MATRHTPSRGSKPDKLMADALRVALHREALDADGKPTKRLNLIADRLVEKAVEGDIAAIKEVFDRIDGRVIQRDHSAFTGDIILQINTGIVREGDGAFAKIVNNAATVGDGGAVVDASEQFVDDQSHISEQRMVR